MHSKINEIRTNAICSVDEQNYGDQYRNHVIEQYKKYLDMADKISDRRYTANNFFLTINTGVVSAIGIIGYYEKEKLFIHRDYVFFMTAGLVLFCYVWYRMIRSYKDLNAAKFSVVRAIETYLPLKPFEAEWEALGRGESHKTYLPFSRIETFVPGIFVCLHLALMCWLFFSN